MPLTATTVAVNAPFVFEHDAHGGLVVSSNWAFGFRFNTMRRVGWSLWALISCGHMSASNANTLSAVVTLGGIALILGAMAWASRNQAGIHADELIILAVLAQRTWRSSPAPSPLPR